MQVLECRSPFRAMNHSPDGSLLASAHADNSVRIWDWMTGRQLAVDYVTPLPPNRSWPHEILWSPDGRTVAAGRVRVARVWSWEGSREGSRDGGELTNGRPLGEDVTEEGMRWTGGAALPDGSGFLCSTWSASLLLLRPDRETVGLSLRTPDSRDDFTMTALHPDGRLVAVGDRRKKVTVWDWTQLTELPVVDGWLPRDVEPNAEPVARLSPGSIALDGRFSADGRWLVAACGRGIRVWDTSDWKLVLKKTVSSKQLNSVAISPDGHYLMCGGNEREIIVVVLPSGEEHRRYDFDLGQVARVVYSPSGMTAAARGGGNRLVVWDTE